MVVNDDEKKEFGIQTREKKYMYGGKGWMNLFALA